MAKTTAEYLASERTDNQALFLEWVLAETGVTFKTAAAREAFDLGVRCSGLYSRFQAAKRGVPAATEPAESKAAKAPAKRAAKASE